MEKAKNPESIKVIPALASRTEAPIKTYTAKNYILSPEGQDLAIVHMDENNNTAIGQVVEPATILKDVNAITGGKITVTGYPGDKPLGTMWESRGEITSYTIDRIYYNASTYGGNSGSPVFDDYNQLIGIHCCSLKEDNMAVRLKGVIYEFIVNNLQ